MDVLLEAVADQLGHASINVTKGVNVHLLPGSRAKAAKAMEELLYKDFVHVTSPRRRPVARPLALVDRAPYHEVVVAHRAKPASTVGVAS